CGSPSTISFHLLQIHYISGNYIQIYTWREMAAYGLEMQHEQVFKRFSGENLYFMPKMDMKCTGRFNLVYELLPLFTFCLIYRCQNLLGYAQHCQHFRCASSDQLCM